MDKVFFTNSGTEAIEGALKIAKRYHYNKLHEAMGDGACLLYTSGLRRSHRHEGGKAGIFDGRGGRLQGF